MAERDLMEKQYYFEVNICNSKGDFKKKKSKEDYPTKKNCGDVLHLILSAVVGRACPKICSV